MERLQLDEQPADFLINSTNMTIGTMAGNLVIAAHQGDGQWKVTETVALFKKSVRKILQLGDLLIAASSKGRIVLVKDQKVFKKCKALRNPDGDLMEISALCTISSVQEYEQAGDIKLAAGDDNGNVYIIKLDKDSDKWEIIETLEEQDDSITSLLYHTYKKTLLAASGDGTILVYDVKKSKIVAHSTSLDDEILSMTVDAQDNVICSTGTGALVSYKWGYWGKVNDRLKPSFHSHSSVNYISLKSSDEKQSLITGTVDGIIRILSLAKRFGRPQTICCAEDSIERIQVFHHDGKDYAAVSFTNDSQIKFITLDSCTEPEQPQDDVKDEKPTKALKTTEETKESLNNFFSGLD